MFGGRQAHQGKSQNLVAWIAERRETKFPKPINKAIFKDGEQVVKIPVTNTRRESSTDLIRRLGHSGVKVNVTPILTLGPGPQCRSSSGQVALRRWFRCSQEGLQTQNGPPFL